MNGKDKVGGALIGRMAEKGDIRGLIKIVEQNASKTDVKLAISAPGQLKSPEAIGPLICALFSEFISIRSAAIRALGEIGDAGAVEPLIKVLQNNKEDPSILIMVLDSLGRIDDAMATATITNTLISGPGELVDEAEKVLVKMKARAVKPLLQALHTAKPGMKKRIIRILGELGDKTAIQPLLAILTNAEEEMRTKEEAVKALAKIKDKDSAKPLLPFLKSHALPTEGDYGFQCLLIIALGEIGSYETTRPLMQLLRNKNNASRIRYCAANSLGRIGDESAIGLLLSLLEDPTENDIKPIVAAALLRMNEARTSVPLLKYLKQDEHFMAGYKLMDLGNL